MKIYRMEVKFTGYITKQFSGKTYEDAKDTARQWIDAGLKWQDLKYRELEFQLLNPQSEKASEPESKPLISISDFDKIVADFLTTQDDDYDNEWYCTHHSVAASTLSLLRDHLFKPDLDKAARKAQYEELKKEFGNADT